MYLQPALTSVVTCVRWGRHFTFDNILYQTSHSEILLVSYTKLVEASLFTAGCMCVVQRGE